MNMKLAQDKPIGVVLLAFALIINRFLSGFPLMDFLAGLLTGLSLVMNVKYIIAISNSRKSEQLRSSEKF